MPHLKALKQLVIHENPIRNEGALALLESEALPPNVFVGLYDTKMNAEGARAALRSTRIPKGRTAQLPEMTLPREVARACRRRFGSE